MSPTLKLSLSGLKKLYILKLNFRDMTKKLEVDSFLSSDETIPHTDDKTLSPKELPHKEPMQVNKKILNLSALDQPLTYKSIFKNTLSTAILFSGGVLAEAFNSFLTAISLRNLTREEFDASSLIRSTLFMLNNLLAAPLAAISITVGYDDKNGKSHHEIARTAQAGVILANFCAVPAVAVLCAIKPLLISFGQKGDIPNIVQSFFWIYLAGVIPNYIRTTSFQFMNGLHKQKWAFIINVVISGLLPPAVTYLLISDEVGVSLGIKGYGIAYLTETWLGFLAYQMALSLDKNFKVYKMFKPRGGYYEPFKKLVKLGVPIAFAFLGEVGISICLSTMAGALGEEALTVQNIAALYMNILLIPTVSIFNSIAILVSRSLGEGSLHDVRRYTLAGLLVASILPGLGIILCSTVSNQLTRVFISQDNENNISIFRTSAVTLPVMATGQLFDAIRSIFSGVLLGMQNVNIPTLVNVGVELLVTIPLMYIFGFLTDLGVSGLFLGDAIGGLSLAILMGIIWYREDQQLRKAAIIHLTPNGEKRFEKKQSQQNEKHTKNPISFLNNLNQNISFLPERLTGNSTMKLNRTYFYSSLSTTSSFLFKRIKLLSKRISHNLESIKNQSYRACSRFF